ncbi:glycosyltransferase family 87 protein [Ralstonia solanacearum]|uniref:glycosyltransferase family 87 protein n=1 Tax=Ralstonia solanacearum TaxID=305 RepID=UPI0018D11ED8|nr:glycosyltransferase family 87 protein [Ralstonia solanacearum]
MRRHTTNQAADGKEVPPASARHYWINAESVRIGSTAMLCLVIGLFAIGAWVSNGFTDRHLTGVGSDFSVFWSASHIALTDSPLHAYDLDRMMAVIHQYGTLASDSDRLLPWLYPPTFLLVVLPLALLSFWPSYLLAMLATGAFYVKATLRLLGDRVAPQHQAWITVVGSPAVFVTVLMGQNSMLTAGLAATAVAWLDKRPVLAGVAIGLLAIKPQLAVLFPVVLIVARAWKTLASAAVTAITFGGVSIAVCGWKTVPAFIASVRWAQANMIDDGGAAWYVMPTFLAAARAVGIGVTGAHWVQMLAAVLAVVAVVYVWWRTQDTGLRIAMLATATMLMSPYLRVYELTWLLIAVAGVVSHGSRFGLSGTERIILVLAWLLPLYEFVNPLLQLPQIGPLVFAAIAVIVVRRTAVRHGADHAGTHPAADGLHASRISG